MWCVVCGVWSVECGVWSVECGVWITREVVCESSESRLETVEYGLNEHEHEEGRGRGLPGDLLGWLCPLTPDPSPPMGARGGIGFQFSVAGIAAGGVVL